MSPGLRVVPKLCNQSGIVRNLKDRVDYGLVNNVVYKMPCRDCDQVYVGQTCRLLKKRLKEHELNINECETKLSSVSQHRLCGHYMDFGSTKVLDVERRYYARIVSETVNIKMHCNGTLQRNIK